MARASHERGRSRVQWVPSVLVQLPVSAVLLAWAGRGVRRLLVGGLRRLRVVWLALPATGAVWLLVTHGGTYLARTALAVTVGLLIWWLVSPRTFHACVAGPAYGGWRCRRIYRPTWEQGMVACGLAVRHNGEHKLPAIVSVRSSLTVDRVRVRMLAGQVVADYAAVCERLAQTFGAVDARIRTDPEKPNELVIWFLSRDPLTTPVPRYEPAQAPDPAALPVGRREDGLDYTLKLLGSHLLIVGATGAGKSSVLWSILNALAAHIRDGLTAVWVVDPKGGMELAGGQPLFARFCHGDTANLGSGPAAYEHAYAELLEDAVDVMRARQARLRGVARTHEPTTDEPLILVVVDELASLTAYATDRDAKKRIAAALSVLLSQGRAVGVLVIAALQDPRKDVLPARDLFPTRIALRMTDPDQVDLVLGDGARNRGARCDRIPESLPGVAYVALDGVAEPVRVRFTYLTDSDIADMCEHYRPTASEPGAKHVEEGDAA